MKVFEKGGAMYTGKIVQTYRQGQEIDVKVMVNFFLKITDFSLNDSHSSDVLVNR